MENALLLLTFTGLFFINAGARDKLNADTGKSKYYGPGEKVTGKHTGTINPQPGWINWQD